MLIFSNIDIVILKLYRTLFLPSFNTDDIATKYIVAKMTLSNSRIH